MILSKIDPLRLCSAENKCKFQAGKFESTSISPACCSFSRHAGRMPNPQAVVPVHDPAIIEAGGVYYVF